MSRLGVAEKIRVRNPTVRAGAKILLEDVSPDVSQVATQRIEEMILDLKQRYAIVIVTHNMRQAARVSSRTAYFLLGNLVEHGPTGRIFTSPRDPRTEQYITGRFG